MDKRKNVTVKLSPESEKLLVELVRDFQESSFHRSLYDGWSGALAAVTGGLLPEHGQYRSDVCTEADCHRARSSLRELAGWGLITLFPANVEPVGLSGVWGWLSRSNVTLTLEGIRYVGKSWLRRWWDNIHSDLRTLIISLIIALFVVFFLPMVAYHYNVGGSRARDLHTSILLVDREIERAESHCGELDSNFNEAIRAAKIHRGNAEDALIIEVNLKTAKSEIKKAQECLKKARDMGCEEIRVPTEPSEWWW